MSLEDNKKMAIASWQAVANGDWASIERVYDPNVAYHGTGPTELKGSAATIEMIKGYKAAFPDLSFKVEHCFGEGDMVVSRVVVSGTNTGEMFGAPATGKKISMPLTTIVRIVDGKVAEEWEIWDNADFMRQLGVGG